MKPVSPAIAVLKKSRLEQISKLVGIYSKKASVNKPIKVAEGKSSDVNASVGRQRGLDYLDFKREYMYVTSGLLAANPLPDVYLHRLVAHEVAHIKYGDSAVGSLRASVMLFPNSKDADLKRTVIALVELRADIVAAKLVGIQGQQAHELSHYYSTPDFVKCFDVGYPNQELRVHIVNRYPVFTREAVIEAYVWLKNKAAVNGVRFNVTLEALDAYVATLNKDWLGNWPMKSN